MTPTAAMEDRDDVVRVKRADGRGSHWIWRRDFDPALHELTNPPPMAATETQAPAEEPVEEAPASNLPDLNGRTVVAVTGNRSPRSSSWKQVRRSCITLPGRPAQPCCCPAPLATDSWPMWRT